MATPRPAATVTVVQAPEPAATVTVVRTAEPQTGPGPDAPGAGAASDVVRELYAGLTADDMGVVDRLVAPSARWLFSSDFLDYEAVTAEGLTDCADTRWSARTWCTGNTGRVVVALNTCYRSDGKSQEEYRWFHVSPDLVIAESGFIGVHRTWS